MVTAIFEFSILFTASSPEDYSAKLGCSSYNLSYSRYYMKCAKISLI